MTPKEEAKELIDRFTFRKVDGTIIRFDRTKKCALICVDREYKFWDELKSDRVQLSFIIDRMEELEEVKQEIEKL